MTIVNEILVVNQLISKKDFDKKHLHPNSIISKKTKRSLSRLNAKNIAAERKEKDSVIVEQISVTGSSFCLFQ